MRSVPLDRQAPPVVRDALAAAAGPGADLMAVRVAGMLLATWIDDLAGRQRRRYSTARAGLIAQGQALYRELRGREG